MLKKLCMLLTLLVSITVTAQKPVSFTLFPDAIFATKSGAKYEVVTFDDKTAHQLYQMLASNVGTIYNDPSEVMSGVEDVSIKIRACLPNVYSKKVMGVSQKFDLFYQLEFRIKDGKVRVSAPLVEDEMVAEPSMVKMPISKNASFSKVAGSWFYDGLIKEKAVETVCNLEFNLNAIINAILGLNGETKNIDEEDW